MTSTINQNQDDQHPTLVKTEHRNHLVDNYSKEESLPATIEDYIPSDKRPEHCYERFMKRYIKKLNDPDPVVRSDSIPLPIAPLF